jgi:hypothetical protein
MIAIIGFLSTTIGRVLVSVAGALALWVAFAWHYEGKGAAKAVAKIERANSEAVRKADAVGSRSLDRNVRGRRDPHSID